MIESAYCLFFLTDVINKRIILLKKIIIIQINLKIIIQINMKIVIEFLPNNK